MKILKRILIVIVSIIILSELVLVITGNTFVNKVLSMTILVGKLGPDIDEVNLFPSHEIANAQPQPWKISSQFNKQKIGNNYLGEFVKYKTVAYLVVRNDSILHEEYWEGYNEHSLVNSFSMAKSINSILIGCALKDGLIKNLDEPVWNYLEEFKQGEKSKITIKNLLTMSSGIDFKEEYVSPLAWPAEAYYGPDVTSTVTNVKMKYEPGKVWHYKGGDAQLLGTILKKVTGKNVADYASKKLWKPIGAEDKAFWSTDEKGMEKVSCCFYTNARDFARIAKLYMNFGNWNGQQIVDSGYVKESITAANVVDREGKQNDKYGYQWWLMKHKNHDIFYMRGIRGQYVFTIPDLKMIVVRLGHKRAAKSGDELPSDIFAYLDAAMEMK